MRPLLLAVTVLVAAFLLTAQQLRNQPEWDTNA